jgi:histidinol dehydrogenase
MQPIRLSEIEPQFLERIKKRAGGDVSEISQQVKIIMQAVKERGDGAIRDFTARFDKAELDNFEVTPAELAEALANADPQLIAAMRQVIANLTTFHQTHVKQEEEHVFTAPGVELWRVWRPIERVGLYVPGGKSPLPSSFLMTAVPASLANCPEIIVCSPPNKDGKLQPPIAVAAALLNLPNLRIFKIGGAQAIAAMAYGTESVPKVYKVFGAGNSFVTTAKMLAFGEGLVNIDMPAGPSEVLVIADDSANPAYVAADLLSQAEHAPDSSAVLLTTSPKLAEAVAYEIQKQLPLLVTADRASNSLEQYSMLAIVDSMAQAIAFANDYAPEHLEVCTENADSILPHLHNAGTVFIGNFTPEPSGDYVSGLNHVLPTGANTKMFGPLSVESFGKKMQVQRMTREGLAAIRQSAEVMAQAEGLPAHGKAISIRFE